MCGLLFERKSQHINRFHDPLDLCTILFTFEKSLHSQIECLVFLRFLP